ncbi:hypothetical protein [Crateriforma conspicua]|uniref:hypothetical protein n=1 Tax=Crateriforma conspicua TaxID=2527996 RepID=UPI0011B6ED6F|nr:hypothetical protein [Crateriforma conspicua]
MQRLSRLVRKMDAAEGTELDQFRAEQYSYGQMPGAKSDDHPAVASVLASQGTAEYRKRTDPMMTPEAFDAGAYRSDPMGYVKAVVPGRVWQTAQPGPGVPVLASRSKLYQAVVQGEAVRLRVVTAAGAPVTFTTFDLGSFENRLPSITVAADDQGVAEASFTGTPGTINDVNILAASPMASGQLHFMVHVLGRGE